MSISLSDLTDDPDLFPPGESGLVAPWQTSPAGPVLIRLRRIYTDLVSEDDWPEGDVAEFLSADALWDRLEQSWVKYCEDDDSAYIARDDGEPVVAGAGVWMRGTATGERYTIFVPPFDPDEDDPNTDDNPLSGALITAMIYQHQIWAGYLTRCKMAMVRTTQFGYVPGEPDNVGFTQDDMAYDSVSSWYKVNRYTRRIGSLKARCEADPTVVAASLEMDGILKEFATQTGVAMPKGATWLAGNRFPIAKQAWEGKLPAFHPGVTDQPGGALDTRDISRRFYHAASRFRAGVGNAFFFWFADDDSHTLNGF